MTDEQRTSAAEKWTSFAHRAAGPLVITAAILLGYWRLTTMRGLVVTDDRIVSDIMNAEFPGRLEVLRLLKEGHAPLWTPRLCGGYPLLAGGGFPDPLTLLTFGLLRPVAAVNVFMLVTLLVAGLGTYALSRRVGASRAGATLSGLAFSWSGYMVCQLKHLGIVSTVCWLPVGLLLLDRALALREEESLSLARRTLRLCGFAAVLGLQWCSNFPQSAYICSLVYGGFALAHAAVHLRRRGPRPAFALLGAFLGCALLGVASAAAALLPLREMGELSRRSGGVPFDFASMLPYSPRDVLTFFVPYIHGDVSNLTYRGSGIFWENYGYVGLLPMLLAIYAVARAVRQGPRFHVVFFAVTAVIAYLFVLGTATPFFQLAFHTLPGLRNFRFPTRFLVVVDLALAVLGGLGLTAVEGRLRDVVRARLLSLVAAIPVLVTVTDLVYHQRRQNPIDPAEAWMSEPKTARFLHSQGSDFRVYTPRSRDIHNVAWGAALGFTDTRPYRAIRGLLQPNSNLFWGIDTCDCYAGLLPEAMDALWGELGLIHRTHNWKEGELWTSTAFFRLLSMNHVRFVLSPWFIAAADVKPVFKAGAAIVYEVSSVLPRARIVAGATAVADGHEAIGRIVSNAYDPRAEVVLEGASGPLPGPQPPVDAPVRIAVDRPQEVALDVEGPGGWLVLADSWHPSWVAEVDGATVPVLKANAIHRAVAIAPGAHHVTFRFVSSSFRRGLATSAAALAALVSLTVVLAFRVRRGNPGGGTGRAPTSVRGTARLR